jgi:serine/threonine protein kinase
VPLPAAACPLCGNSSHDRASCPFVSTTSLVDEPVVAKNDELPPGTAVGEYEIETVIGRGAMGTVYRAVHPLIGKRVAIKVLVGSLAHNDNAVKRFTLEARAVNQIRHRNLVDIFSFGRLPPPRESWYLVMEYLEGQSLGERLEACSRMPAALALPIFIEVAEALGAAHDKGVVHRDLKPDNVFLVAGAPDTPPSVKLLDFGVAKLLDGHTWTAGPRTVHGSTVGTPHYMSPEQARGQPVDGRSDLYAFGVLLYRAVTGVVPIDGPDAMSVLRKQVLEMPYHPMILAPGAISPQLDGVIMKLLAKDPARRYQTAAEVRAALLPLLPRRT